jgi:hypothetical protein
MREARADARYVRGSLPWPYLRRVRGLAEVKHGIAEPLALGDRPYDLGPGRRRSHARQEENLSEVRGESQSSSLEVPLLRLRFPAGLSGLCCRNEEGPLRTRQRPLYVQPRASSLGTTFLGRSWA